MWMTAQRGLSAAPGFENSPRWTSSSVVTNISFTHSMKSSVPRGTIRKMPTGSCRAAVCKLLAICLVGVVVLLGCSSENRSMALVVGMDLSYPPFETIDEKGKPTGISVRLAEALADFLGRPLRIENIPFVGLIPSLQNKRIDCIISSMTDTPERRQSIAFSDAYLSIGLALLAGERSDLST